MQEYGGRSIVDTRFEAEKLILLFSQEDQSLLRKIVSQLGRQDGDRNNWRREIHMVTDHQFSYSAALIFSSFHHLAIYLI
jgi:hypothetical protein